MANSFLFHLQNLGFFLYPHHTVFCFIIFLYCDLNTRTSILERTKNYTTIAGYAAKYVERWINFNQDWALHKKKQQQNNKKSTDKSDQNHKTQQMRKDKTDQFFVMEFLNLMNRKYPSSGSHFIAEVVLWSIVYIMQEKQSAISVERCIHGSDDADKCQPTPLNTNLDGLFAEIHSIQS